MPSLSIVIPVYNIENYIHVSLNSLLMQDDDDFEIIIVNDGSTDKSVDVARDIFKSRKYGNYKIFNKANGGVCTARNMGIAEAQGKYVFFLDGDDYVSSNFVSTVKSYFNRNDFEIIAWAFDTVNESQVTLSKYFSLYSKNLGIMTGVETLKNILTKNRKMWICTCSAVYNRNFTINNNLKYVEGCTYGEDSEFVFKALSIAKRICFIDEVLSFYLRRDTSVSMSFNIRNFDGVEAVARTSDFLKLRNNDEKMKDIILYLEREHMVSNYLNKYLAAVVYYIDNSKLPKREAIEKLIEDIDSNYPGLLNYVNKQMKLCNKYNLFMKLKLWLYLVDPILFARVWHIYYKIKTKMPSYKTI